MVTCWQQRKNAAHSLYPIHVWQKGRWSAAFWQRKKPQIGYTTPHYYPKYEIWAIEENKLVNNPCKSKMVVQGKNEFFRQKPWTCEIGSHLAYIYFLLKSIFHIRINVQLLFCISGSWHRLAIWAVWNWTSENKVGPDSRPIQAKSIW